MSVFVWHREPPKLGTWLDGEKYDLRRHDKVIVYEKSVQIGAKMTEWGVPQQANVVDLARIDAGGTEDERLLAMWECGRHMGHREGYAEAMADVRKLIGVKP